MLQLKRRTVAATLAGIATCAFVAAVAVQQDTWDVEDPQSWVTVLDSALAGNLSEYCSGVISMAKEGVEAAIATGGLKWCRFHACGRVYDDHGWTFGVGIPGGSQLRINKRFQNPEWTGTPRKAGDPIVKFGNVLIHESNHAFELKKGIESAHSIIAQRGNSCYQHVQHPKLLGQPR